MQPLLDIHLQLVLQSPDRTFVLDAAFQSPHMRTALMGPSGSGKSTVLLAVAGLQPQARGHVRVNGSTLLDSTTDIDLPARDRGVGMVFQDYALFPHMTVEQNLLFGVRRMGSALADADRARVDGLLDQFDLQTLRNALPRNLSGGQKQRVALARALAPAPRLLLLDEPLGALDALTRIEMHQLIEGLWQRNGFTALLVTHDVQEAVALADRVILIEEGRIALDERIPLARPRQRSDPLFGQIEKMILDRVLQQPYDETAARQPVWPAMPAHGLRWAV